MRLSVWVCGVLAAACDSGAYEAEVPVNSQGESDRNGALARALGNRSILGDPASLGPDGRPTRYRWTAEVAGA